MIRSTRVLAVVAALACGVGLAAPAWGAEAATQEMDKLFAAVAAYTFGQDEKPLIAVAELVRRSHKDAKQRRAIEERLVKLLETGTPDSKRFVCLQLWTAASSRSVPALTGMLTDDEFSDAARYALERMADPAAGRALREAVGKTKGRVRIGVVNSLAHRRDKAAVALIVPLLGDKDQAVVAAAAWALGRIGTARSARELLAAHPGTKGSLRRVLDDACLLCADALVADRKPAEAAAIYQKMYAPDEPRRIRIAALRGLMISRPEKAAPLALEAMKSLEPHIGAVAGVLLRSLPGEEITRALGAELPKLAPDRQIMMLDVLARRGDPAATPAVLAAAGSTNEAVRLAAIAALGRVGGAKDVPMLAHVACKGSGPIRDVARAALVRLRGDGVERALMATLKTSAPAVKAELIRVLSARWAASALPEIVSLAGDSDKSVRAAALQALGALARENDVPALLGLLARASADDDRKAAGEALGATFMRAKDKQACAAAVLAALPKSSTPARCVLLRLLAVLPGDKSLAAVRTAMKDADERVRDAATRALTEWPGAEVVDDLLAVAATGNRTHRILAVRGCVRVLALGANRSGDQTVALYARLLKLASRPEEKKLVLAALAEVGHVDALKLIEPLMADRTVQAEARSAAIKVARAVAGADYDLARGVLEKIAAAGDDRIKQEAAAALAHINQHRDYILAWMLSGPYTAGGKNGPALFGVVFTPENPHDKGVRWRPVSANAGVIVDLAKLLGGENRVAYLRTTLVSPGKREAVLELGSDDGIKVWLNGKVIHANNASRGVKPGEDKVRITLRPGENTLMLKINNGSTDWAACARITGPDGKRIAGLKVIAR